MIDFEWKISLKIGDGSPTDSTKSSFVVRLFSPFKRFHKYLSNWVVYLSNDEDWRYWCSYENGDDAYQLLINRNYPTGFYYNAKNPSEMFFKTYSLNGNPVFGVRVADSSKHGQVSSMHGQTMVPTSALLSTSVAERHVVDAVYDQGLDPFIPLKIEYDGHGNGYAWYGRYTHFTPINEYFEKFNESLLDEELYVKEWLDNYIEEEDDTPVLAKILEKEQIMKQQPQKRKYTKKKVD